jgi:hypothetical protein
MEVAMQATVAHGHPASSGLEHGTSGVSPAAVALLVGVLGLLANVAYVTASALPHGAAASPVIASLVGPLIAGASVALYLLLASERATLAGQFAVAANVAAGALLTAMLLLQLAVDDVETALTPAVNEAFEHVEFGLDLAWDVFLVAGTILFGWAMLADRRFGRWLGISGIAVAAALYVFNFATFPTPPGSSGLVDLGPAVGLWYAAVSVQALRLRRGLRQTQEK